MNRHAPAPNWRRLAAMVYDSLIILAITMAYGAIGTIVVVAINGSPDEQYPSMFESKLWSLGWLLTVVLFYCWFWQRSGQTVGMRAWRLKLIPIRAQSLKETLNWSNCIMRSFWGIVGLLLLGANYWYRLLNKKGDCLHDRLSGSRVVVIPKAS